MDLHRLKEMTWSATALTAVNSGAHSRLMCHSTEQAHADESGCCWHRLVYAAGAPLCKILAAGEGRSAAFLEYMDIDRLENDVVVQVSHLIPVGHEQGNVAPVHFSGARR